MSYQENHVVPDLLLLAQEEIREGLQRLAGTSPCRSIHNHKVEQARNTLGSIKEDTDAAYEEVSLAYDLVNDFLHSTYLNGFVYEPFAKAKELMANWKYQHRQSQTGTRQERRL